MPVARAGFTGQPRIKFQRLERKNGMSPRRTSGSQAQAGRQVQQASTADLSRIWDLKEAIAKLTSLTSFPALHAQLESECEPLVRELETTPPPRQRAIAWLDLCAERYLNLVTDLASWDSYRLILRECFFPTAFMAMFGPGLTPVFGEGLQLERRLNAQVRFWQQQATEKLARSIKQARPTVLARNLDRLRMECNLSLNELASKTDLDKKLLLRHLQGKKAVPKTLATYAETFSTLLERKITPRDLLTPIESGRGESRKA